LEITMIDFDGIEYRKSHGKPPKGRGGWAFGTRRNPDVSNPTDCLFAPGGLTLADAKKWAKAKARELFGADAAGTLYILS
jgi:hypothetical protein